MEEPEVVNSIKDHLKKEKWFIHNKIKPGHIHGQKFFPDIVAESKEKDLLVVECKGSLDLNGLMGGIGQCVTYGTYGANLIYFGIPYDKEKEGIELLNHINIHNKGKIGLFIVNKDNTTKHIIQAKKFKLPKQYQALKGILLEKLVYIADMKIEQLGAILDFAYNKQGKYEKSTEFVKLIEDSKATVFPGVGLTHRMITNFMVTINHLSLWDTNYVLNEEGRRLRDMFKKSKEDFKKRLSYLFLTDGNWLSLLRIMHILSKDNYPKLQIYNENLVKELIKENYLPKSNNVSGLAKKMGDRYHRFLKDFEFIEKSNNKYIIRWDNIVNILRKY